MNLHLFSKRFLQGLNSLARMPVDASVIGKPVQFATCYFLFSTRTTSSRVFPRSSSEKKVSNQNLIKCGINRE
jgi:hypothetical protein